MHTIDLKQRKTSLYFGSQTTTQAANELQLVFFLYFFCHRPSLGLVQMFNDLWSNSNGTHTIHLKGKVERVHNLQFITFHFILFILFFVFKTSLYFGLQTTTQVAIELHLVLFPYFLHHRKHLLILFKCSSNYGRILMFSGSKSSLSFGLQTTTQAANELHLVLLLYLLRPRQHLLILSKWSSIYGRILMARIP
jgi:hypothetical protein